MADLTHGTVFSRAVLVREVSLRVEFLSPRGYMKTPSASRVAQTWLRSASVGTVTIQVKGSFDSWTGDRAQISATLRSLGVSPDRVSALLSPFKDVAVVAPAELNKLLRARVLTPAAGNTPKAPRALSPREADARYDSLIKKAVRAAQGAMDDYLLDNPDTEPQEVARDLADGSYGQFSQEFEKLFPYLGLSSVAGRRRVINTLADYIA